MIEAGARGQPAFQDQDGHNAPVFRPGPGEVAKRLPAGDHSLMLVLPYSDLALLRGVGHHLARGASQWNGWKGGDIVIAYGLTEGQMKIEKVQPQLQHLDGGLAAQVHQFEVFLRREFNPRDFAHDLRVCEKFDERHGTTFALPSRHFAEMLEIRLLFERMR